MNEQVKQYLELVEQMKTIEKRIDAIKGEWLATNGVETEDYLVVIRRSLRESVAGKGAFAEKFGENFLKENDLLRLSEVKTVVVQERATHAKAV